MLVEQNLEIIAELAKRVLLIQKGTILRELQPGELRQAAVLSEFVGVDRARPSVVLGAHRLSAAPRSGRPGARRAER
jgi:ABC-type multidrug transport system ATPase subunit